MGLRHRPGGGRKPPSKDWEKPFPPSMQDSTLLATALRQRIGWDEGDLELGLGADRMAVRRDFSAAVCGANARIWRDVRRVGREWLHNAEGPSQ